jgi:hypothetical protein
MDYSTTFGTRKKLSSVAGAFFTMSAAMPPSVTTSSRIFIAIGVTDVIGSTPSTFIHLRELLDKRQHGVELALEMLNFILRDRNAREMRDAADGCGIDGHAGLTIMARA